MTKKHSIFKLLIISLITLSILLWAGFFLFSPKAKKKESQISRSSSIENCCFNCNKKVEAKDNFCGCCGERLQNFPIKSEPSSSEEKSNKNSCCPSKTIKIQKTSSGKYFVKWRIDAVKVSDYHAYLEEGKKCISVEEMPKFLAEHQKCWENNDWSQWEKELKDNYLLVKSWELGENGQFRHQTYYEFHPISKADREEAKAWQRVKEAERIREECKERAKEAQERARKWKEEHKNEWKTCSNCGRKFCLETEGSITTSSSSKNGGKPVGKTEYFCDECSKK